MAVHVVIFYLLRRKVLPIGDDHRGALFSEGCLALLKALQDAVDRAPQGRSAAAN